MITKQRSTCGILFSLCVFSGILQNPTNAANRYWINASGGIFSSTSNWSNISGGAGGASVPAAADSPVFNIATPHEVYLDSNVTNLSMYAEGGDVTLDLNGKVLTLTSTSAVLIGQSSRPSYLTVKNGLLSMDTLGDDVRVGWWPQDNVYLALTDGGRLGNGATDPDLRIGDAGSLGHFSIYGIGSANINTLTIGSVGGSGSVAGIGTASISGAQASLDVKATGTVGSTGIGSLFVQNSATATIASLRVGDQSIGNVEVDGGGQLINTSGAVVGYSSGGVGAIQIAGEGSLWDVSGNLLLGNSGQGTAHISSGGQVRSHGYTSIGELATGAGQATISGMGTQWISDDFIDVGYNGTGSLTIADGGQLSATILNIGRQASGTGTVSITGPGTIVDVDALIVAQNGAGTLTLANDASLTVRGDFTNKDTFEFNDGLLQVRGSFQPSATPSFFRINGNGVTGHPTLDLVGPNPTTNITSMTVGDDAPGELRLRQGRFLDLGANNLNIGAKSGSEGTVTVESSAELHAASLSVGGTGSTAGGTGTLKITNATVITSTLRLFDDGEINFDGGLLAIDSIATLEGRVNWTSGELFVPGLNSLSDSNLPKLLGPDRTLRGGQILRQLATVDITASMVIDGGLLDIGTLNIHSTLDIRSGVVHGYTTLSNSGVILLNSPLAELRGTSVENSATIRGTGAISGGEFINMPSGQVEVITGDRLHVQSSLTSNVGHISVIGGELQVDGAFSNLTDGLISARDAILRFAGVGNSGSLAFSNGTVDVYGDITQNVGGRITVSNGGIANFYDDVTISAGAANVQATALGSTISRVVFFGSYNGGVTGGGQAFIEGDHRPGNSPALVEFGGDVSYGPFASLEIELAGNDPGNEFDVLQIAGAAALGGTLDVNLLNGFVPAFGDTFRVITAASGISGTFDNEVLPDVGTLLDLRAFYDATGVTLAVVPSLTGDYNADGVVDAADYAFYRNSLGQIGVGLAADGNGDQVVNQADYDVWRSHYGQTIGSGSLTDIQVPEPTTYLLAMIGLVALCWRPARTARCRSTS